MTARRDLVRESLTWRSTITEPSYNLLDPSGIADIFRGVIEVLDDIANVTDAHAELLGHAEFSDVGVTGRDIEAATAHAAYVRQVIDQLVVAVMGASVGWDQAVVAAPMRTMATPITRYDELARSIVKLDELEIGRVPARGAA